MDCSQLVEPTLAHIRRLDVVEERRLLRQVARANPLALPAVALLCRDDSCSESFRNMDSASELKLPASLL